LVRPIKEAPADTTLTSARGLMLRPVEDAIGDYLAEVADRIEAPAPMGIAAE
jgi:hypothetical protein